jgi:protease-4
VKAEDIIDYTAHEGLPERVLKKFGASVGSGAVHSIYRGPAPSLR